MKVTKPARAPTGTNSKSMFTPSAPWVAMTPSSVSMAWARFVALFTRLWMELFEKLVTVTMTFTPCAWASATICAVVAPPQP